MGSHGWWLASCAVVLSIAAFGCGAQTPRADATPARATTEPSVPISSPAPSSSASAGASMLVPVGSGDREGVLFTGTHARELLAAHGLTMDATWSPDAGMLAGLEDALPAWIRVAGGTHSGPRIVGRWPSYRRQYAGIVRGGRRLIFASYFCERANAPAWRTAPISVMDGGDCYFVVAYDPSARTFSELSINGEA